MSKRLFTDIQTCERCGQTTDGMTIMSMFNTETICMDCKHREQKHPQYEAARAAEWNAIKAGDYNYPGIGLPDDLRPKPKESKNAKEDY